MAGLFFAVMRSGELKTVSPAVGVVLHVDVVVHGGGDGVSFFVGGDVGLMLHGRADIVEALEQNFFAGRRNFKFEDQAVFVGDSLIWQIDRQRIAFFFFGAFEKFIHLLFGKCCGQNAVLETVVVENVRVTRRDNDAEAVVL